MHKIFALSIAINKGSIHKESYSVLHITHDKDFTCIARKNSHQVLIEYICQLPSNIFVSNFAQNEYDFLKLSISKEDGKTYLNITPKSKQALMYPMKIDLLKDIQIRQDKTSKNKSKHWTIFFSNAENNLIFKPSKIKNGLDFNVKLDLPRPFIGRLDEDRKPIGHEDPEEINTLLKIRHLYEQEDYTNSLAEISLALQHDKPLFKKELLLYSLRNYHKINKEEVSQHVVDIALDWLNEYHSDKNIPEILFYLGVAYSKLYQQAEAIKVFNELVQNYDKDKFSELSKLELGDNLKASSNINESIKLYEDVLYNTKNVDIALLATQKIAKKSLDDGVLKRARYHYSQIIEKDIDFLVQDIDKAYALAIQLSSNNFNDLSVKVLDRVLEKIDKKLYPGQHSSILFETAELYVDINTDKAIVYYQTYLKLYPKGVLAQASKEKLDKLIFQSNKDKELSDEEILANIEYLMKTYPNQPIAHRAFYKKMKIFSKRKKYTEVLSEEEKIKLLDKEIAPDKDEFINKTKMLYAISLLNKRQCGVFVKIAVKYKLQIDHTRDDDVYTCMYEQFRYKSARKIVDRRLVSSTDSDKTIWAFRLVQILVKNLDYSTMIPAIKDLFAMIKLNNIDNKEYNETIYNLFFAYVNQNNEEEILKTADIIDKNFEGNLRNIRVFAKLVQMAQARLDDRMAILYAEKVKALSRQHNVFFESPWIDYALFKAYSSVGEYDKALKTLKELSDIKDEVQDLSMSKLNYMQSEIYRKMKKYDTEKIYLQYCADIKNEKIWPKLCKDTLQWI